ncbi:MAG: nucleotidyltransferase family protein [Planctomycetes bacterium]|nr:nucleotidyltransferase family protein [Planctomycetota bacterium]
MNALPESNAGLMNELAAWLRPDGPPHALLPKTPESWKRLARRLGNAGLAGLVLARNRVDASDAPLVFVDELRRCAHLAAAHTLNAMSRLERLVVALNHAQVPVILLKGAALNLTIYDRPDLRPMGDVDLLVRRGDVDKTIEVLLAAGCHRGAELVRDNFFPKYYYETELVMDSPMPVRIDLHVRPLRPMHLAHFIEEGSFWANAQPVPIGSATALIPSRERMLVHLAAHAAYHGCARLLWLYDLKRYVEWAGGAIEWNKVVELSTEWRVSLPVRRAFDRAGALLGPILPANVRNALSAQRGGWRDRLALAHAPRDAASPVRHVLVNLACARGIRHRLGYLAAVLFPARGHLSDIYPWRHMGWTLCAQAWRFLRPFVRPIVSLAQCIYARRRRTSSHAAS